MNCITYKSAEAITTDGLHWDIYVTDDELLEGKNILPSEIRYGSWSVENGLKRGPIFPSNDFKRLEHLGATVYEYLLHAHDQVPFLFWDRYELWLLDQAQQPLALLDSVVREEEIDTDLPIDWRAGLACRNQFSSPTLKQLDHSSSGINAGEYLTHYINQCTGERPVAQWFQRHSDGSSVGLAGIHLDNELRHRHLDKDRFPELLVQTNTHDIEHSQLIEEFLSWQAPWLLLLASLDRETRQSYEQLAHQHALVVAKQYRLYPETIDDKPIRAARVEAKLRGNRPDKTKTTEPTFYIELADFRAN